MESRWDRILHPTSCRFDCFQIVLQQPHVSQYPNDYSPGLTAMAATPAKLERFKLVFFVPPSSLSTCKAAIFAAGAGRYPGPGNYTECCWTSIGTAQFRPGDTANPNIGNVGVLEDVQEFRFETLCVGEQTVRNAVEALKKQVWFFSLKSWFLFLMLLSEYIRMRYRLMKSIS